MDSQSKGENAKAAEAGNESEANKIAKAADKPSARKPKKAGRPKKQKSIYPGLAPYESAELPPITEFALLAAILGPRESYPGQHENAAFGKAVKFYQRAAEFHRAYGKATPEERARLCGDVFTPTIAKVYEHGTFFSTPEKFPATYDEFLKLVVKGKDETESTPRLRHFFASEPFPTYEQKTALLRGFHNVNDHHLDPDKPPTEQEKYPIVSYLHRAGEKRWPEEAVKGERFFYIQIGKGATAHKFRACSTDGKVVSDFFETRDAVREWLKHAEPTVYSEKAERLEVLEPEDHIAMLKQRGFQTLEEWAHYAYFYFHWWQECVATTNRANKLGKTKQPPTAGA